MEIAIESTVLPLGKIARIFRQRKLKQLLAIACSILIAGFTVVLGLPEVAQTQTTCARPAAGSIVVNPPEIQDPNDKNPANFTALTNCYLANGNLEAPTLRVRPGKKDLVLNLTNRLTGESVPSTQQTQCIGGMAPPNSTSLHYHGMNISPQCVQDEVVKTIIKPNETFGFKIEIPKNEPPGMYWYHPHVHTQSEGQVLRGLTGAIIVEGIKKFNKRAADLNERVLILRDFETQEFPDSDTAAPGKDISINSVPIRYVGNGQYDPPAVIQMQPNESQFWRVANTAADTYFDLQVTYDGTPQTLQIVAMDGVPINADGKSKDQTLPVSNILLSPAGRAEFIVTAPSSSVKDAKLLTRKVDRGSVGDNDTERTIAKIDVQSQFGVANAKPAKDKEKATEAEVTGDRFAGLSQEASVAQRTLFFSQNDSLGEFYITLQGNTPKAYSMSSPTPDITVQEGTTEEWIVENRALEAHAFHIHQIHFLVLESPISSELGIVRDTINVPAWNGNSSTPFPRVRLRMDFRGLRKNSSIAGTFVYHCHVLEHEDGGMMAAIEVKPA